MLLNEFFATFCTHPANGCGAHRVQAYVSASTSLRGDEVDKRLAHADAAGQCRNTGLRVVIACVNKTDAGTRVTFVL